MRWWISVFACAAAYAAGPVEFGKAELDAAIAARHIKYKPRIVAELNLDPPETFRIEPYAAGGGHISGGDLRGLMYGLLEAADQMRANGRLKQTHGTPAMGLRSVRMMADPKASWFGSEEFWRGYFAQMAHARFNRVQLEFAAIPERSTFVAMRMISQTGTQYGVDVALGLRSAGGAQTLRDLLAECPMIHSVVLENADAGAQALLVILHQAGRRVVLELNQGAADPAETDHLGVPLRRFAAYDADRIPPPQDFYWRIDPAQDPAILSAIPPEDGFEIPRRTTVRSDPSRCGDAWATHRILHPWLRENRLVRAAAVFPDQRSFQIIDHPEPRVTSPTEVKLRMLEVGICGTDKEIAAFDYGTPPAGSPYLVIGHESLGEVIETGAAVTRLKPGDLAVPTVRRPCDDPQCIACRSGRQDFCYTGRFTERGINQRHGFMTELVLEEERYVNPVPQSLREVAVLVEPLTIAEKALTQLWQVQSRLPWMVKGIAGRRAVVLGAGPVGLLGAMKLVREGFDTTVYSRRPAGTDLEKLVGGFGAKFVAAETVSVEQLAAQAGNIDVIYEAVGASSLAFEVMPYLGTNGVFIFTGVPGRKAPITVDTDTLMRDYVLKNQVIFGTVNASIDSFAEAIADIGVFLERWPEPLRGLITARFPLERAGEPLSGKTGGIKNVISVGK